MITHTAELPVGIEVDGKKHTHLVIRESNGADQFNAEEQAPVERTLSFTTAQAGLQVVSIGDVKGPFTLEEIKKWHKRDQSALLKAWGEVEKKSNGANEQTPSV